MQTEVRLSLPVNDKIWTAFQDPKFVEKTTKGINKTKHKKTRQ